MGLDTSHGAWHGSYSAFMRWREKIAEVAGMPPLSLMQGFYQEGQVMTDPFYMLKYKYDEDDSAIHQIRSLKKQLPIKWSSIKPSPLHELLYHSDCDGYINWKACGKIADELEKLIPLLPDEDNGGHIGNWRDKTKTFINGCRLAFEKKEKLNFH